MITNFNIENCRDSAIIYSSVLEQVEMLYEDDRELAGELAIAAIQTVLSGETTTDNKIIQVMLKQLQQSAVKNQERYEKTKEKKRAAKVKDKKLEEIAELHLQGCSLMDISSQLNLAKSTVFDRLNLIKSDYPELLQPSGFPDFPDYVTDTDTDTDTDTVTDTENETVTVNDNENDSETVPFGDKPRTGVCCANPPRAAIEKEEYDDSNGVRGGAGDFVF